jgi:hypothetical protein
MPLRLLLTLVLAWHFVLATARGEEPRFDRDVRTFVRQHCLDCHSSADAQADINLERFDTEEQLRADSKTWERVFDQVRRHHMPPPGSDAPSPEARERFLTWLGPAIRNQNCDGPPAVLPVLVRRLTRSEYQNSLVDLLGITTDYRERFPADGAGGEGFDTNAETLFIPPVLMERYLAVAREAVGEALESQQPDRVITVRPNRETPARTAARETIGRFAQRAYRRPVEVEELDRLMLLYDRSATRGDGFVDSLQLPLIAVLCSPNFLFRIENAEKDKQDAYDVSPHELAVRLSYFLWAGPPDDELFRLAETKQLHDPKVLEAQVRRMLADARARRFAKSFTEQWLKLRDLGETVKPDAQAFPEFTPELTADARQEAILLVEHVFRENRPLSELLDADYTFLNDRLAHHYGIDGVAGPAFRRVDLKDRRRGGVITMAGPLALTSYPLRTSPVLRGVWVLDQILGTPSPPPPADVPELEEGPDLAGLSLREKLSKHRESATCAACHQRIDPLGFALESYDAIGRYRETVGGKPIDVSGELPDGTQFDGASGLKDVLRQQSDDFLRSFSTRLLAYALGRGIENEDFCLVDSIVKRLRESDLKAHTLVVEIVTSPAFLKRRNP